MELDWWTNLYDQQMADFFLERTTEQVHREISVLEGLLQLNSEDTILDQCCGIGTLSQALANRGYRVIGVDIIPEYIH